jgi:hypothetical protein
VWIQPALPPLPDGIAVAIGPLVGLPDDRESWIANALREGVASHLTLKRIAASEVAHDSGWPVTVVAISILDGAREIERRIAIMFRLEVLGGLVIARVAAPAIVELEATVGRALLTALLAAPIRMHGSEVVAIAELDV